MNDERQTPDWMQHRYAKVEPFSRESLDQLRELVRTRPKVRAEVFGMRVYADPSVPDGHIEARHPDGRVDRFRLTDDGPRKL